MFPVSTIYARRVKGRVGWPTNVFTNQPGQFWKKEALGWRSFGAASEYEPQNDEFSTDYLTLKSANLLGRRRGGKKA